MKNIIKNITVVLVFAGLFACDMLEPLDENRVSTDYISTDPESAEGVLLQGYNKLINQWVLSEAGTDDAVNNQLSNGYKRMATGELTAQYNPANRWNKYEPVFYLNKFIAIVDGGTVKWTMDEEVSALFDERLKGEALALRALHHFYILQAHAGIGTSGELLGIPYYKEFIPSNGEFNVPRLSFEATIEAILADFDEALTMLPYDYSDNPADSKYPNMDHGKYITVNGAQYNLRISGRIATGLKARIALFAASPSFLDGGGYYEEAADAASEIITLLGGVSGLSADGINFSNYNANSDEFLWRGSLSGSTSSTQEKKYFPPSRNGEGQLNPSHNLVSAFPMLSGYPATEDNGYDPQDPYTNRDPRLEKFIVVNGSKFAGGTINTGVGGGLDRLDSVAQLSTNTGYYLKKLLHPDVRLNADGTTVDKKHFNIYYRYTELFLILAESANEIGGPDYEVDGISSRDVIASIRERAGITQPDEYLASITTKEEMRELIRNERRIELSFEGHRFWDMRRWGLNLNETITGYFHNGTEYVEVPTVEARAYPSHGTYMPIPNNEVVKFSELEQNQGW